MNNIAVKRTAIPVLVVDDDAFVRKTVVRLLEKAGFQKISEATNGVAAIKFLEVMRPRLILLDLNMEQMNGLQFLKLLRSGQTAAPRDLPVIIFTSADEDHVLGPALALDCDAFLMKPSTAIEMATKIHKALTTPSSVRDAYVYDEVEVPETLLVRRHLPAAPQPREEVPKTAFGQTVEDTHIGFLQPGDRLAEVLLTPTGSLLLSYGTVFTEGLIYKLQDLLPITDIRTVRVVRAAK
jgi:CheY-like chemotaxis protein